MNSDPEKLLAALVALAGSDNLATGRWASIVRTAAERVVAVGVGSQAALSPQPLPPRSAFALALAQAAIDRAELMWEITDPVTGEAQRGIIVVGGYLGRFAAEFTSGSVPMEWPLAGHRPQWFSDQLSGLDLLVISAQFAHAAKAAFAADFAAQLAETSRKFLQVGLERS